MRQFLKLFKKWGGEGPAMVATLFFLVVVAFFALVALYFPQLYILATYEDLPGEWTQVFFFAATLIIALRLARRAHPYRLFFMLLALACLYVVGEEISWGQRLLAFTSPEFFQRHNLQQEVNLHNFLTGPLATWPKRVMEITLVCCLLGYGLIYPLLQRGGNRPAKWLADHGLPVPPLYLSPYFVTGALCEVRLFSFNEAEVAELLIAMALAFLTLHHYLLPNQEGQVHAGRQSVMLMVSLVFVCLIGAGGVSWYCWQAPRLHEQTAGRIAAGQKKFAGRYYRHGAWHNAAQLYEARLLERGEDRELLRSLADCYRQMGDEQRFWAVNGKAIRLDMRRYGRNPRLVSVNLSLFASFQQGGDEERARFHLGRALAESRDQVELAPYNASNFYWYGRSLLAQGDSTAAIKQFARAVAMRPSSARYLQAYRRVLYRQEEG